MPRVPGPLTCADCGKTMWMGTTSLPQGQARCLSCRRSAPQATHQCGMCGKATANRMYCSHACMGASRRIFDTCEVCGSAFPRKYSEGCPQRTCSRACGKLIWTPREPKPPTSTVTWHECPMCATPYTHKGKRRCGCVRKYKSNGPSESARVAATDATAQRRAERVAAWACVACGDRDNIYDLRSPYCKPCRARVRRDGRTHRHRARRFGVDYEPVNVLTVYARDQWTCHLCLEPIDPTSAWPDQMCASLDHVVPMSAGGAHSYANTRAAHWLCNVLKGSDQDIHFRVA